MVQATLPVGCNAKPWYRKNNRVVNTRYDAKSPAYPSEALQETVKRRVRPEHFQAIYAMGFADGEYKPDWMARHDVAATVS